MNPKYVTAPAAVGIALVLVGGCGSDSPGKPEHASTDVSPPASTAPAEHHVIRFADTKGEGGVVLENAVDVSKLDDVPDEFKVFVVAELLKQQASSGTAMTECHPKDQLIVNVIDTAGHAAGAVEFAACAGAQVYWAKVDGRWREVLGGQIYPQCDAFKQYGFPVSVVEKCSQGTSVVTYAP